MLGGLSWRSFIIKNRLQIAYRVLLINCGLIYFKVVFKQLFLSYFLLGL